MLVDQDSLVVPHASPHVFDGKKPTNLAGFPIPDAYGIYGGFHSHGGTLKWVYNGKSIYKWMIWGQFYFRKPPHHLQNWVMNV